MSAIDAFGGSVLQTEILGLAVFLVPLVLMILMIAGMWKAFEKADKPGWAAIIPIYNVIVLLQIVGRPVWWVILFFIPLVNFVVGILVLVDTVKAYGQGIGFALGLLVLPVIFWPILGFGDARYQGAPH